MRERGGYGCRVPDNEDIVACSNPGESEPVVRELAERRDEEGSHRRG